MPDLADVIERTLLRPGDKLIRVRSWRPRVGIYGVEWPTMLIDRQGYLRETIAPVWGCLMFRETCKRIARAIAAAVEKERGK